MQDFKTVFLRILILAIIAFFVVRCSLSKNESKSQNEEKVEVGYVISSTVNV